MNRKEGGRQPNPNRKRQKFVELVKEELLRGRHQKRKVKSLVKYDFLAVFKCLTTSYISGLPNPILCSLKEISSEKETDQSVPFFLPHS